MTLEPMTDETFYQLIDETIDELMKGVKHIVCDIGRLNDVLLELHRRQRELKK